MSTILYHCHEARSMRSLWLLNELELEFELIVMPFDVKTLRSKEYLAISPLGRVPCLVDEDQVLFESGAIAQYLCETYDPDGLGRPPGNPERPEWLQWIHFSETMAVHGASLVQQNIIITNEADRSPLVQKLEKRRLEKAVEVIDRKVSGSNYLLKGGFSAADIAVGYSLHLARLWMDLEIFNRASAYYQGLSERVAFKASLPKSSAFSGTHS